MPVYGKSEGYTGMGQGEIVPGRAAYESLRGRGGNPGAGVGRERGKGGGHGEERAVAGAGENRQRKRGEITPP